MHYNVWELTNQEIQECTQKGISLIKAQAAKEQAYIDNGGVILNPDALPELYEALKAFDHYLSAPHPHNMKLKKYATELMEKALAKAEGRDYV